MVDGLAQAQLVPVVHRRDPRRERAPLVARRATAREVPVLLTCRICAMRDDFGSSGEFGQQFGAGVARRDQRGDGEAAGGGEMIAMRVRDLADQTMGSQQE